MRKRPSARVLIVDPDDRVLLFHFVHTEGPLTGTAFWATPGGSLAPRESFAQAARRELFEETGIDAETGPEIALRSTQFMMPDGERVEAEERYFLVRSSGHVDIAGNPDPVERGVIAQACWVEPG